MNLSPRHRRLYLALIPALVLMAAAGGAVWWARYATYHYATVQEGVLYRDGNRTMREFAHTCRQARIKTVVMLNDDTELQKEPFKSEEDYCRRNGIRFERIPIAPGKRPTTADVQRFLRIMEESQNRPVLVHCAQGLRRTGMMVAAYQRTLMGYSPEQAKDKILLWGRKLHRLDDVRGFIDDYDPVRREVGSAHVVEQAQDAD
jgi:protein tyrosine/serine phosphatase